MPLTPLTVGEADRIQLQGGGRQIHYYAPCLGAARPHDPRQRGGHHQCGRRAPGRRFAAGCRQVAQALSRWRHPRPA